MKRSIVLLLCAGLLNACGYGPDSPASTTTRTTALPTSYYFPEEVGPDGLAGLFHESDFLGFGTLEALEPGHQLVNGPDDEDIFAPYLGFQGLVFRVTEALREAMLELRGRYGHPYYWAPFVFIGAA